MNRTILNKATSPDPSPTPGYLFDEIAKVTHDPVGNDRLVEYFVKRLESPSPDVKAKVLNIIKHVCRKGNASFRRAWQRESPAIKAYLQYHTVPDPLRGDEPSRRVRENAKEALEAVFDASKDERKADPVLAGRIQGFGVTPPPPPMAQASDPYASSQSSRPSMPTSTSYNEVSSQPRYSGGGGSRYEGIGNPNFVDPRNQPKGFLERMAETVRDRVEKNKGEIIAGVGGVKPPWMTQNSSELPAGYSFASNRNVGNYPTNTGTYDPGAAQRSVATDPVWSDPRSPRPMPTVQGQAVVTNGSHSTRSRGPEPSDGTYERQFINELCAPGGVRPIPPKDKLDAFCKACRTLDPQWVISYLDEKMSDDDWKVQHKALCVLEAVLHSPGLEVYADAVDEKPDRLEALYNSKNPSVRDRAQKVWKFLYEDADTSMVSQSQDNLIGEYPSEPEITVRPSGGHVNQAVEMNLLDFGEPPSRNVSYAQPTAPSASVPSMFGSLNIKSSPATPTAPVSSTAQAGAGPASSSSGFSFLGSGGNGNMSAPPPPKPANPPNIFDLPMSQPAGISSSMDFFSMPMATPTGLPPVSQPQLGNNMFGQMSAQGIKPPPAAKASIPTQPATQKKMDSFNFVQEALQSTRKV